MGSGVVERGGRSDELRSARMLADAFFDDPFVTWMYPSDARRKRRFDLLVRRLLQVIRPHNRVLRTAGFEACAVWIPPAVRLLTLRQQLGMLPEVPRMGRRAPRTLAALDNADRHHPVEPHWYLFLVGSDPELRGAGYGKAVIEPVLDDCDRAGLPAYLESSNPDNVGYYERFGFRVTGELRKAGSPPLIPMWRDPEA